MCNMNKGTGDVKDLLRILLCSSEKAATVARQIRQEKSLFNLLIQEKLEGERNPRFVCDFKTLADVLIQESIRNDLTSAFPGLSKRVFGEENSSFTNSLGEKVHLRLQETVEETADLLQRIYNGNSEAAHLLARLAHTSLDEFLSDKMSQDLHEASPMGSSSSTSLSPDSSVTSLTLDLNDIAFWIDPIDSTSEYIHGDGTELPTQSSLSYAGLANVTVLIGAFQPSSGLPLLGIINQPFSRWNSTTGTYESDIYWGYCSPDGTERLLCPSLSNLTSLCNNRPSHGVIVCSSSEVDVVKAGLENDFSVESVPGAGYKFLAVVQGLADAYVLLKANTFAWDSCGPHGIMRAMGGNVLKLRACLDLIPKEHVPSPEDKVKSSLVDIRIPEVVHNCILTQQVLYSPWIKGLQRSSKLAEHCHKDGVVAFLDISTLHKVLYLLAIEVNHENTVAGNT